FRHPIYHCIKKTINRSIKVAKPMVKKYLSTVILFILFLIIWEIIARMMNIMFILPSPTAVGVRLWELKSELLLNHLPATLIVTLIGLIISIILGVAISITMKFSPMIEKTI